MCVFLSPTAEREPLANLVRVLNLCTGSTLTEGPQLLLEACSSLVGGYANFCDSSATCDLVGDDDRLIGGDDGRTLLQALAD